MKSNPNDNFQNVLYSSNNCPVISYSARVDQSRCCLHFHIHVFKVSYKLIFNSEYPQNATLRALAMTELGEARLKFTFISLSLPFYKRCDMVSIGYTCL